MRSLSAVASRACQHQVAAYCGVFMATDLALGRFALGLCRNNFAERSKHAVLATLWEGSGVNNDGNFDSIYYQRHPGEEDEPADLASLYKKWREKSYDLDTFKAVSGAAYWPIVWVKRSQQWWVAECYKSETWRPILDELVGPELSPEPMSPERLSEGLMGTAEELEPRCEESLPVKEQVSLADDEFMALVRSWCGLAAWYPRTAAQWMDEVKSLYDSTEATITVNALSDVGLQQLIHGMIPFMRNEDNQSLVDQMVQDLRTVSEEAGRIPYYQERVNLVVSKIIGIEAERYVKLQNRYTEAYKGRVADIIATYFSGKNDEGPDRVLVGNFQTITGIQDYESYELKDWAAMEEELVLQLLFAYQSAVLSGKGMLLDDKELALLYDSVVVAVIQNTATKQAAEYVSRLTCVLLALSYGVPDLCAATPAPLLPFLLNCAFAADTI